MRQKVKKGWFVLMTVAVLCILLASPAAAVDRYWINWFSGDWVDGPSDTGVNWMNSAGETGLPSPGDRALIVLPYPIGGGAACLCECRKSGSPSQLHSSQHDHHRKWQYIEISENIRVLPEKISSGIQPKPYEQHRNHWRFRGDVHRTARLLRW